MKKNLLIGIILCGLTSSSFASIITFTDFNGEPGVGVEAQVVFATQTVDGITFELKMEALVDGAAVPGQNVELYPGSIAGVTGGTTIRLDGGSNQTDNLNVESIKFSLSILSGEANVDTLTLGLVDLTSFSTAGGETARFSDGATLDDIVGGVDASTGINYDNNLDGLTALSKANIGAWSLEISAPDINKTNAFSINAIGFNYTLVPEPTTMALFLLGGLVFVRRRIS